MIYKKRARVYVNDENAKCVLTETQGGKIIAAITDDANDDIASITSFVHTTTSFLNGEKSCEVTEIKAINNIYTMFRLQKFYYESLHRLGFRYMWMETSNHKLVEAADMLYCLYHVQGTNIYYADLNRMFYHDDMPLIKHEEKHFAP